MKLIKSLSRWGTGYIPSYYKNGKRISRSQFMQLHSEIAPLPETTYKGERTSFGYRDTWEAN